VISSAEIYLRAVHQGFLEGKTKRLLSLSSFYRPFSRWTWVSRCLLKPRMMEVVVTAGLLEL